MTCVYCEGIEQVLFEAGLWCPTCGHPQEEEE